MEGWLEGGARGGGREGGGGGGGGWEWEGRREVRWLGLEEGDWKARGGVGTMDARVTGVRDGWMVDTEAGAGEGWAYDAVEWVCSGVCWVMCAGVGWWCEGGDVFMSTSSARRARVSTPAPPPPMRPALLISEARRWRPPPHTTAARDGIGHCHTAVTPHEDTDTA